MEMKDTVKEVAVNSLVGHVVDVMAVVDDVIIINDVPVVVDDIIIIDNITIIDDVTLADEVTIIDELKVVVDEVTITYISTCIYPYGPLAQPRFTSSCPSSAPHLKGRFNHSVLFFSVKSFLRRALFILLFLLCSLRTTILF